jgi:hypothetical protein
MRYRGPALAVILVCGLARALHAESTSPPVGYQTLAAPDLLWQYNGKTRTAMSSSNDPSGGNMDLSQFHGKYRGEKILARIDGPGCIYRIWSAAPSGTIKVYLDGAAKPEISCGFKPYLKGECAGLPSGFTVGRVASYMPIPFAKSIIITAPGFSVPGYYQISYQIYDPSVPVQSFKKADANSAPDLAAAQELVKDGAGRAIKPGLETKQAEFALAADGADALALTGAGVIRRLRIADPKAAANPLAGLELRIYWDGARDAAVSAPVDAFFVNRFDLRGDWPQGALKTMFVRADAQGYEADFAMPFAAGARVELVNRGPAAQAVKLEVMSESMAALPPGSMRFHAFYRAQDYETDISDAAVIGTKTPIDPATNYVVLDRPGRGHYLGCAIFVASVGTPWWGEGDENTWIDGAAEPQIKGTGTEDEFNWSWGFKPNESTISGTLPVVPECKENIAGQLVPQLRNPECQKIIGHNIAYRFRVSDYVPFDRSIKVSYEVLGASYNAPNGPVKGNLSQLRGDDYSSIAYWYEAP